MLCHFKGHTNTATVVDSWRQFWLVGIHAVLVVLYFEYFYYSYILLACSYPPTEKPAAACLLTNNSSVFVLSLPFSFFSQILSRNDAVDVTFNLKGLYNDTKAFLDENLVSGGGWNKGGQSLPSEDGHGLCLDLGYWKTCRSILSRCLPGSLCCINLIQGCHWLCHFTGYANP